MLLRFNRAGAVFVAAINGSAMGGGCELALACDIRLMAAGPYLIGQPEILFGFPPGGGGTQRLAHARIGPALRLCLEGLLEPDDAHELGLIDEVVGREQLMDRARAVAERLARRPKGGIAGVKRACIWAAPSRCPRACARSARSSWPRSSARTPSAPWPPTSRASSAPARCPVTTARRSSALDEGRFA